MSASRTLVLTAFVMTVGVITSGALASTTSSGFFKTPSGKIVCLWFTGTGGVSSRAGVVCSVFTGLKPPIPKAGHPECAHLDYVGNRVGLSPTGHVQLLPCVGDAGRFADPAHTVYLYYGGTKSIGSITGATRPSAAATLVGSCSREARSGPGWRRWPASPSTTPRSEPGFETADTSLAAVVGLYGYYGSIASRRALPSSPFD